jgi:hypothetical protein
LISNTREELAPTVLPVESLEGNVGIGEMYELKTLPGLPVPVENWNLSLLSESVTCNAVTGSVFVTVNEPEIKAFTEKEIPVRVPRFESNLFQSRVETGLTMKELV